MKAYYILIIGGIAVAIGYVILRGRKGVTVGSTEPFDPNAQAKIILTETTDTPGTTGGSTPLGSDQQAGSARGDAINDALATGETKDSILPGIKFLSTGVNPVSGEPQSIFELDSSVPLETFRAVSGFKDKPGFAGYTYLVDDPKSAYPFKFDPEGGRQINAMGFVELLPKGSGSTAQNVIYTGTSSHPGSIVAPATLKPGDPGYNAALESARSRIAEGRAKTTPQNDRLTTVKIGDIELRGNFAMSKATPAPKAEPRVASKPPPTNDARAQEIKKFSAASKAMLGLR